jgi:EmrB/QacA subfamily drug resistance transporter
MVERTVSDLIDEEKARDGVGELGTDSSNSSISSPAVTAGGNESNDSNDEKKNDTPPEPAVLEAANPPPEESAPEPEAGRTKLQTTLIVGALCTALFLAALDMSIVTTAVPTIAEEFRSNLGYTWVGTSYLLGCAAFVPTWGKLSDIWGRKPIMLSAVGIFWVGSLLCGVSVNMTMLIVARAVQGIGGGGVIALVNICISDLFSMRNRSIYFGIMSLVWAFASAVGPVFGGLFTYYVTWRWCFYVNLPISGVGMIVLVFVLKLHNPRTPAREGLKAVDWIGSGAIIGGTVMFLLGLELGGVSYPWSSPRVVCLLVFGVAMMFLFGIYEWKVARYPVVPVRLFKTLSNLAIFATAYFHGAVFISGSYWLPLYFQGVLGASSMMSGLLLIPYVVVMSFTATAAGFVIKKTGKYLPSIVFGTFITTIGFGLFLALEPRYNYVKIILFQIVAGIGIGPNFQSPLIALQTSVEPRDIASATCAYSFIRQMATSMSVVIGGVVFNNGMQKQYPELVGKVGPELADVLSGHNAAANVGFVSTLPGEVGEIARGAYFNSLRTMYIVFVVFAGAGFAVSLFIGQNTLTKEHKEHKTGLKTLRSRESRAK